MLTGTSVDAGICFCNCFSEPKAGELKFHASLAQHLPEQFRQVFTIMEAPQKTHIHTKTQTKTTNQPKYKMLFEGFLEYPSVSI